MSNLKIVLVIKNEINNQHVFEDTTKKATLRLIYLNNQKLIEHFKIV